MKKMFEKIKSYKKMHRGRNPTSIRALFVDFPGFPDLVRGFPFPQTHPVKPLSNQTGGEGWDGGRERGVAFIPRMNDDKWRRLSRGSLLMSGLNNFAGSPYRRENMLCSFVGHQGMCGGGLRVDVLNDFGQRIDGLG